MLIRPTSRWQEKLMPVTARPQNTNVVRAKRDIYIDSIPTVYLSEEMKDYVSRHVSLTIVNRSLLKGGLLMTEHESAEWTYLKSTYIFQAYIGPDKDGIRDFRELTLHPQTEMTTGYTCKEGTIHDLGMSVIGLDTPFELMNLTEYNRLKAIDPRFYSDRDHQRALFMFPDDFLPQGSYKGADLIDENTRFYKGSEAVGYSFMRDTGEEMDVPVPIYQNQIMTWRALYLQDAVLELFYPPSVASIDSLVGTFDSKLGVTIDRMTCPRFIPDRFAKRKANEFVKNLRHVGEKITRNLGDIRLFYYTSDQQDRLKVYYHDKDDALAGGDYTVLTVSRADVLDQYLVQTRPIR